MPAPGGILALDLSLTVGWSYGVLGQRPVWGHWLLGRMAEGGAVYARLEDEIDDAIKLHRPATVVYEAPFAPQQQSKANVGRLLLGLCTVAELIAYRHGVRCFEADVRTCRKQVLGSNPTGGAAKVKPVIMAWAERRGWKGVQDDEADALCLLQHSVVFLDRTSGGHFFKHGETL
jgi:Holliday junction resolvasome RuvABC endonuclease subunit